MKNGNWVPIDKNAVHYLPYDRAYTRLEALFSIQVDYNNNRSVSVAGYSKLWQWSRNKVLKFLSDIDIVINYPDSTSNKQNQKGQIKRQIKGRSRADQGQIKFKDSNDPGEQKDRSRADQGQIKGRSKDTTNNNIKNKDNNKKTTYAPVPENYVMPDNLLKWAKDNKIPEKALKIHTEMCLNHFQDGKTKRPDWSHSIMKWARRDLDQINHKFAFQDGNKLQVVL